jgi:hypothetical protein
MAKARKRDLRNILPIKQTKIDKDEKWVIACCFKRHTKWVNFLSELNTKLGVYIWEKQYKIKRIHNPITLSHRYKYWKDIYGD